MAASERERNVPSDFWAQTAITYGYMVLWIFLSAVVIMVNKFVLAYAGFPFPIALTLTHMAFCSALAFIIVKGGFVNPVNMDMRTYCRNVLPIAALFSGTLWLGNAAYLYLSVAFIQMLKAQMPVTVFLVGVLLGTEKYSHMYALNMVVVGIGIATASYGEINFNFVGVIFQIGSIVTESFRLCLIQLLLQASGIKLNPVTTLYYVAPACFVFLCIPFAFLELPKMLAPYDSATPGLVNFPALWLFISAVSAFALNMSVFLLIGRSSALTMNVAGVIKDWLLILLSVMLYESPVGGLQIFGYAIAFGGVCWYNYQKLKGAQHHLSSSSPSTSASKTVHSDPEGKPLLGATSGPGLANGGLMANGNHKA